MNKAHVYRILTGMMLFTVPVPAHLSKGSLSFGSGETFNAGDEIEITWKMSHAHPISHFIYFRADSQSEWSLVDSVEGSYGNLDYSYSLTIPDVATEKAQIRVFLPEFSKTPSEKNDDFTLISEPFTISVATKTVSPVHRKKSSVEFTGNSGSKKVFSINGRVIDSRYLQRNLGDAVFHLRTIRR